jgi:hypothetical protein
MRTRGSRRIALLPVEERANSRIIEGVVEFHSGAAGNTGKQRPANICEASAALLIVDAQHSIHEPLRVHVSQVNRNRVYSDRGLTKRLNLKSKRCEVLLIRHERGDFSS